MMMKTYLSTPTMCGTIATVLELPFRRKPFNFLTSNPNKSEAKSFFIFWPEKELVNTLHPLSGILRNYTALPNCDVCLYQQRRRLFVYQLPQVLDAARGNEHVH